MPSFDMNASNSVKVSVIIPVYNAARYLPQCLDTLINQTLREIEVILINDCSTDDSGKICEQYAGLDSRFRVIHNVRNMRQGPSRNTGIETARGEYIGFMDADDWIDLDYYEKLYYAAISGNYDIAKTEPIIVDEHQNMIPQKDQNQRIRSGLRESVPLHLLFTYEHWTAIYRREVLIQHEIRYPNIRNAQDDVFLLYCTWYSTSIILIDDTFYYYRQHEESVTAVREAPYYESILNCFELKVDFLNRIEMPEEEYLSAFTLAYYPVQFHGIKMPDHVKKKFQDAYLGNGARIYAKYRFGGSEKILEYIMAGLEGDKTSQKIQNSYAYRLGNAILWLPFKIKSVFLKR